MKKLQNKQRVIRLISLIGFFFFISIFTTQAQKSDSLLFDLTGKVVASDSLKPIPDTHLISKFNQWGTISDDRGLFRMMVSRNDSLLISSMGYSSRIVQITDSILKLPQPVLFTLDIDTILIHEVVIHGFWDYRTFKQMIINMKPMDLQQFYPNMDANPLLYRNPPTALVVKGPIQALYDIFNKNARLQRKLVRHRKEYNRLMINLGREKDTIPSIPEHMREKLH